MIIEINYGIKNMGEKIYKNIPLHGKCKALKKEVTYEECDKCYYKNKIYRLGKTKEQCRNKNIETG